MGDLSSVLAVVHEEDLELLDVVDAELVEAAGEEETGLLVVSVTAAGHGTVALKSATDSVINSSGLSPRGLLFSSSHQQSSSSSFFFFRVRTMKVGEKSGGRKRNDGVGVENGP